MLKPIPCSWATFISCLLLGVFTFALPTHQPSADAQPPKSIKDAQQDDRMDYLTKQMEKDKGSSELAQDKFGAQIEELRAGIADLRSRIDGNKLDERNDIAQIREENASNYGVVKGACIMITFLSGAGLLATIRLVRKVGQS